MPGKQTEAKVADTGMFDGPLPKLGQGDPRRSYRRIHDQPKQRFPATAEFVRTARDSRTMSSSNRLPQPTYRTAALSGPGPIIVGVNRRPPTIVISSIPT